MADVIPPPLALPPISLPSTNKEDHNSLRQVLVQLSSGASSAENASQRCQQTLRDVQKLLDPKNLTQYRFKAPKNTWKPSNHSVSYVPPELSPFANMVYNSCNVEFLQGSSNALKPRIKLEGKPALVSVPSLKINGKIEAPIVKYNGSYNTKPSAVPSSHSAVPVISQVTAEERASYFPVNEITPTSQSTSVDQGPTTNGELKAAVVVKVDQKQRTGLAVQNLQSLLYDIFEAEDSLQADTSGKVAHHSLMIFAARDTESGSVPVLQTEYQLKLDSHIQKAIGSGQIHKIEAEYLARVQRICESSVAAVESLNLIIGDEWTEDDVQDWLDRLGVAERGLIGARTLLRIMSIGPHLKELQSEDYVRAILAAVKATVENFMVPLLEEKISKEKVKTNEHSDSTSRFNVAMKHRKQLQTLLNTVTKVFRTLDKFLTNIPVDETTISRIESLSKLLIFAENPTTEKDSVFGIQTFEVTRRCAMDVLAKIFIKYVEQRQYIIDEILISLEKLPATKQSARQYRLTDCKPIQLVSALLMRLIQTSATYIAAPEHEHVKADGDGDELNEDESSDEQDTSDDEAPRKRPKTKSKNTNAHSTGLLEIVQPLHDTAQSNAAYIVKFLVTRALSTSKSSDEPFRRLLDIFTADFLEVLGSSDWPAAEILLRVLVSHMIGMVENHKSTAASRIMALELLGTIGSGILQLQTVARNAAKGLDTHNSTIAKELANAVHRLETDELEFDTLVAFNGPYRMVIQHLQEKTKDDVQLQSAQGYHLMQWAWHFCETKMNSEGSQQYNDSLRTSIELQDKVRNMIVDSRWLEEHYEWPSMETREGQLSAVVITLSSRLCKAFNRIFSILLNSMSSEQPAIRNRGLKSVAGLLETDPSILDRNSFVLKHISRCADDSSPLVRASALGLYEKCSSLRPSLDEKLHTKVLERTRDTAVSIRKLALAQVKKFYLRNESATMRSAIANSIIARMEDLDESVRTLARQTMEEIWFQPLYSLSLDGDDAQVKPRLEYGAQVSLLISTILYGEESVRILEALLIDLLTQSKAAKSNAKVCRSMIRILFDGIIDNTELPGSPDQRHILLSLTVFAKSSPKLFTSAQIERLEPYTKNLSQEDDFAVYRSTICILRHTLPFQTNLKSDFLSNLQTSLMVTVQKLRKAELEEVVSCLWTINNMLGNIERLVNLVRSALAGIWILRNDDLKTDTQKVNRISRLMIIVGEFGKVCDFDREIPIFRQKFPEFQGSACSDLLIDKVCPFTSPKQPLAIRERALDAVCTIAQEWPKTYLRSDVVNAFETVFKDRIPVLEEVLLSGLEGFYRQEDANKGAEDVPELGTGVASGKERLGRTYVATDRDGASTSIAQRFLAHILRLALGSCDEVAFIAARLVVSINKHSLVLPKQSAPALVALETCPNAQIANLAFHEHRDQHTKRESLFEKEYMRAIDQVFQYQRDVIHSTTGFVGQPPVPKMHLLWEVLKGGKAQVRKKFLGNMVAKLDFEFAALSAKTSANHLAFVRFVSENLALFDYDKIEDVAHLLTSVEKMFSGIGTTVAQAIESEVLKLHVDALQIPTNNNMEGIADFINEPQPSMVVDTERLSHLTVAAQICSIIWETRTFIRRLWNMQKHMNKAKNTKDKDKEVSRTAIRVPNATNMIEGYLKRIATIMSAVESVEGQHALCRSFVETINIDTDVKVASEDENDADSVRSRSRSPSAAIDAFGNGKRRRMSSVSSTPRKKSKASPGRRSVNMSDDDEDDVDWK